MRMVKRRSRQRSRRQFAGAAILGGVLLAAFSSGCPSGSPGHPEEKAPPGAFAPVRFTEIAKEVGIDFRHENGAFGDKRMPETVGAGCAFFDWDNDGDQDLLVVNSSTWADAPKGAYKTPRPATTRLYRNDQGKFTDISRETGIGVTAYGMGVSVADYDGDGWQDVYLTCVGPNFLFRNESGKRFRDVTRTAGVQGVPLPGDKMKNKWSSGAAFFDYDNDGKLDLWVCQYVKWSPENDPFCGSNGVRGYCPPGNFEGARCTLYHNEGGKFRDVSRTMGLFDCALGKSFGIGLCDFNRDGWMDLVVTNDTWANFLFINEKGKKFSEQGVISGIAYGESGRAKAGMGVDVADVHNDGNYAIVVGNFTNEGISFFEPEGELMFTDQAHKRGIAIPSLKNVTFAMLFLDYDLDGWQDVLATNGHVDDVVNTYQSDVTFKQRPLLMHSEGGKHYTDVTKSVGLERGLVGRGAAYGDIDNDGDLDIALVDNGGQFLLFRNDGAEKRGWIRFRLEGVTCNRDAIGAQVKVTRGKLTP